MDDCVFCKIISGKIPAQKNTYQNGDIISFLDNNPRAAGHTLVIPRKHTEWFLDMDDAEYMVLMQESRNIARMLKKEHKADYVQLMIVGKDVHHVHVHLIPRKLSDLIT